MSDLNEFIKEELQKRKNDYLSSPAYILEHHNIEKSNIEAYNGRQLLEMLQNADDASENASEKKVLIKLDDDYLTIANNGEPFNEDGLRSIIYSNLSSKTLQQNKIGQKGLGFRSILSWADKVIINSGQTQLAFSKEIAQNFLANLLTESIELSTFLKQKSEVKLPIAILRVPELLNNAPYSVNNFDTTISIKLKKNIINDVQSQILSIINKETLIFLNNIEIIEIDSPKRKVIYKKSYSDESKEQVSIESEDLLQASKETKTWQIKRKKGTHKEKNYELAIAWNHELDETENVLFSYFKTEVRFPFPALLHGTFELTPDRNQLVHDTDGHNEYLTEKLSELLIETALDMSKNTEVSYLPLKILNIEFDKVDNVLQKFNFKETLIEKIKSSKVFPSVNNVYNTYIDKPVFYEFPVASFINGNDVKNLMPICTDKAVIDFLKTLSIFRFHIKKFISIISTRATKIEISSLAKLIYFLLNHDVYQNELKLNKFHLIEFSEFLLDSENIIINWDSNIFIQPQNAKEFNLPKYLNVRFLNQNLVNALLKELETNNTEILLNKLKPFGVKKYSFLEVTEILIQHFKSKEKIEDVIELHTFLFRLFKNELTNSEPPQLSHIDTPIISGNKKIRKANLIYFGKHYGNPLTEHIYKYDKSKLLAQPTEFRLEGENEEDLKKYFKWLGVEELPRKIIADAPKEFAEYTFKKYDYKHKVGNHHFTN
jgi:hypothetical protein